MTSDHCMELGHLDDIGPLELGRLDDLGPLELGHLDDLGPLEPGHLDQDTCVPAKMEGARITALLPEYCIKLRS